MLYLAFQILWFLVAAAAIGFAVGWLSRRLATERRREIAALQAHGAQEELAAQCQRLEARLAEATGARDALQEEVAQLRQTAEADAKARRKLEREHSSALIKLEAREREVARLTAELGAAGAPQTAPRLAPVDPAAPAEIADAPAHDPAEPAQSGQSSWRGKAPVSGALARRK